MSVDPRNFLINTDYPLDKVIYITSGVLTVPGSIYDTEPGVTIPHTGITCPILPILIWSETADFAIAHELYDEAFMLSYWSVTPSGMEYNCASDSTNVYIFRYNNYSTSKTIHYRIFGLQPTGYDDTEIPHTSNSGSNFILNTDYNYMKLVKAGTLTSASPIYNHNLGYVPRTMIWEGDSTGLIYRSINAIEVSDDPTGSLGHTMGKLIDTTKIQLLNGFSGQTIHYRIYGDE